VHEEQESNAGGYQTQDVHRRFVRKDGGDPSQASAPSYSPITRSSIVFNEMDSGELGAVICRLRESIGKRGLKGWRNLVQRFQQYDYKRNGTVMRLDWERLHKSLGLGLSPEEREVLFKGLSVGRGAMNYDECLRRLRGSITEQRQAAIEKLFDALVDPAIDKVPVSALKAAYNPRNAPLCLLGRMDPTQAKADFNEAMDFFGSNGDLTIEEFMDIFLMISTINQEDDEFRLMTTAAFGVAPAGRGGA